MEYVPEILVLKAKWLFLNIQLITSIHTNRLIHIMASSGPGNIKSNI